jgi:hypothetical protein
MHSPAHGRQFGNPKLVAATKRDKVLRPILQKLAGQSLRAIAAELDRRGIKSWCGKPWNAVSVRNAMVPRLPDNRGCIMTHPGDASAMSIMTALSDIADRDPDVAVLARVRLRGFAPASVEQGLPARRTHGPPLGRPWITDACQCANGQRGLCWRDETVYFTKTHLAVLQGRY